MSTLKTLEQYNKEKAEQYNEHAVVLTNGIECPKCKSPLYDTTNIIIYLTYPPQKDIHCKKCNWSGLRVV